MTITATAIEQSTIGRVSDGETFRFRGRKTWYKMIRSEQVGNDWFRVRYKSTRREFDVEKPGHLQVEIELLSQNAGTDAEG